MYVNIREEDVSWAINVLKNMVSIATVNPPGLNYEKFAGYVSRIMRDLGFDVEVIEVPRDIVASKCSECKDYPRYVVLGRYGSGEPVVHFNGHYDVVPPGEGWKYNPFEARVENGRVYGRGSVDMKGGIASILLAVKTFLSSVRNFKGSIEVALVPDEEIGGETGTGYLVHTMGRKPSYVVIAEGSGSANIWIGHKGLLWGFVEIIGKQAHGSTPWKGVNAFEYMAKVAVMFAGKHEEIVRNRKSKYDYGDPEGARPTLNLGGEVKGSTKINVVPGFYAFSFDRRIIPEESPETVENEIRSIVETISKEFQEVKIGLRIVNKLTPALTSGDSTLVRIFEESIEKATGLRPRKIVCLGGLDMHYYTEKSIETIAYGPGPSENAHTVNEYVDIDEVVKVARVYVLALSKLLL